MRAPHYIQNALDRHFPGVRLEWQPVLQWWILTEPAMWPDGMVARDIWFPRPGLMRGIAPWKWCQRRPFLFWGVIEDGIRAPLSLDAILETLWKYRQNPTPAGVNDSINQLEARELERSDREKRKEHERTRDRLGDMFDAHRRVAVGGHGVRLSPWRHSRAVDREYAKREREATEGQAEEIDAEVTRRLKGGYGVSAIRRAANAGAH